MEVVAKMMMKKLMTMVMVMVMIMMMMVVVMIVILLLTAQVTYPDFKYDCEALAVDPVTRYIELFLQSCGTC